MSNSNAFINPFIKGKKKNKTKGILCLLLMLCAAMLTWCQSVNGEGTHRRGSVFFEFYWLEVSNFKLQSQVERSIRLELVKGPRRKSEKYIYCDVLKAVLLIIISVFLKYFSAPSWSLCSFKDIDILRNI